MKKLCVLLVVIPFTILIYSVPVNEVRTSTNQVNTYMSAPGGNYVYSCKNIETTVEGNGLDLYRVVKAECRRANGQWQKTSIRIPLSSSSQYDVTLTNNDGRLEIGN